jgi:hypothetical protein
MNASDDSLLDDLRAMWLLADPPPPGLAASMVATVAAADLDREWELLVLVRDSADEPAVQVRGLASARILYFTAAEGWSLDAEIDGDQVRGQLLDFDGDRRGRAGEPRRGTLGVRPRRGRLLHDHRPGERRDPLHRQQRHRQRQQQVDRGLRPHT